MAGNYITMSPFPFDAFDHTEHQRVPTLAAMDGLVGALTPTDSFIPTFNYRSIDRSTGFLGK